MDKARKRLRVFLVCLVLTAIVVGCFYYYYQMQDQGAVNKGTLVSNQRTGWEKLCL